MISASIRRLRKAIRGKRRRRPIGAAAFLSQANAAERAGQKRIAKHLFACAALLRPKWAEPHRKIGIIHWQASRLAQAAASLSQAHRLAPRDPRIASALGRVLVEALRHREALPILAGALRRRCPRRDRKEILGALIHVYGALGDAEAIRALFEAERDALPSLWRFPARLVPPRYAPDGHIANGAAIEKLFGKPVDRALDVMALAEVCAEASLRYFGDYAPTIRFYEDRLAIQGDLIARLGWEKAPLRYMTDIWIRHFGHLGHIDFLVKLHRLGLLPGFQPIIFSEDRSKVGNRPLLSYWELLIETRFGEEEARKRHLEARVLDLDLHCFHLQGELRPCFYQRATNVAEARWEQAGNGPLLKLRDEHEQQGRAALKAMGIPDGAWFATVHVRDAGFFQEKDASIRNARIETYFPAMQAIIDRGGWVIRLGDAAMPRLPAMARVIDYAHSALKDPAVDLFLLAACRFMIGVSSGPSQIPALFGVPRVCTNWTFDEQWYDYAGSLLIHKHYLDLRTGEPLPYPRFLGRGIGFPEARHRQGIRLEDNTPTEIRDVTVEMMDRLDGTHVPNADAPVLQARLRDLMGLPERKAGALMGEKFLLTHRSRL